LKELTSRAHFDLLELRITKNVPILRVDNFKWQDLVPGVRQVVQTSLKFDTDE